MKTTGTFSTQDQPPRTLEGFTVDGAPIQKTRISPILGRALTYLDGLPFKKLVTKAGLATNLNCDPRTIALYGKRLDTMGYRTGMSYHGVYYGSRETIAEFKKQLEQPKNGR